MRPNHKGRIAGQCRAAECQCRRFEVEDRLKKRFRSQKDLSQLWCEQPSASALTRAITS
jgi:hypothetical protein